MSKSSYLKFTCLSCGAKLAGIEPLTDATSATLCGLAIPDNPYMDDTDDQIPEGTLACKNCERRNR